MTSPNDEWEVVCGAEWSIVNELGNKIDLGFKLLKRRARLDVLMRIAGPTSEATNQVTLMEAREICRGLKDLLAAAGLGAGLAAEPVAGDVGDK